MERSGKEVISGTQTEVYPPLRPGWGKEQESLQAGRTRSQSFLPASRLCSHNLSGEQPPSTPRALASSHKAQTWQRQFNKNRRRLEPPKSRPANKKKNHRSPKQHSQEHLPEHLESLTLCPSRPPAAPARLPSGWAHAALPGAGSPPGSPAALGKFPAKLSRRTPLLTLGRGQAGCSPRSGPAARTDGEQQLFRDNQRWEAAPVNSVHPVAAGSVSSSWQQLSQEQWWAQLEIFHN